MMRRFIPLALAALVAFAGCTSYTWRASVPEEMRTVSVPVFKNASDVTGLGSAVTTQVLREFQREGTFAVARAGEGALEVQGEVRTDGSTTVAYERRTGARSREHRITATAVVTVTDRKSGRIMIDRRKYTSPTTFLSNDDTLTGERDAAGRMAEGLARQIVDDVLMMKW